MASFPSSYIVTTTASATRAADVLTVPVSGIDYPLSLFVEFERAVDSGGTESFFSVRNNDGTERSLLRVDSSDLASFQVLSGGSNQAIPTVAGSLAVGTRYKMAGRSALNDFKMARDGTLSAADTSGLAPSTPTTVDFGQSFGYFRRAAIWNRTLIDAELQSVST